MAKSTTHLRGYAMILLSALMFGSYGAWARIIGGDFGVFFQGWVRSAIVLAILVPIMVATKSFRKIKRTDWKWLSICVLFSVFTQVPIYYAFNHTSIGTATLIFYAVFVMTSYLIARLFLGETITKVKVVAILLAVVGLALVFGLSLVKFSVLGLLLAALNGIASGGEVSTSKKVAHEYSSLLVTFWVWVAIFVTHLMLSLVVGERQIVPAFNADWLAMLAYAIAGLLGFWLVIEGFKFVDASIGSLVGLLEIVFGILFGMLFFHEKFTWIVAIGAVVIIFAAMLPDLLDVLQGKRTREPVEPLREI